MSLYVALCRCPKDPDVVDVQLMTETRTIWIPTESFRTTYVTETDIDKPFWRRILAQNPVIVFDNQFAWDSGSVYRDLTLDDVMFFVNQRVNELLSTDDTSDVSV